MAKVLGLGGVFFKSRDPEKLSNWYQKWLGMPTAWPYGLPFQAKDIPANGCNLWTPFKSDSDYFSPSQKDFMFNLMVDDLPAMMERLKQSDAQVMPETEQSEYGHFGWFIDPEGNKVELWQPPEKMPQDMG